MRMGKKMLSYFEPQVRIDIHKHELRHLYAISSPRAPTSSPLTHINQNILLIPPSLADL